MSEICVHVKIEGRVQGVWYRSWTLKTASGLGLSGWVRNRKDGSVEAVFSGPRSLVNQMISNCHEGPAAASVDDVHVSDEVAAVEPGFKQLRTE